MPISLEEKIKIFEEFAQTGEELKGNTIYNGYPIGVWGKIIRSGVNRLNDGKANKTRINLTKEQLARLEKSGVLKRQIDSTVDEKIDSLIEWRKKYPKATIMPKVSNEVLREYAKTEEEWKQLIEKYEKMLNYYEYVRTRKSKNRLDKDKIEKCKEGNIGGVFGNSTEVNNAIKSETDKLTKNYGLNEEIINLIRKQYGSIDEFRKIYIKALINHNVDQVIPKNILENVNLIREFDLSSSDWVLRNNGLASLIWDITGVRNVFVKYEGLEDKFIDLITKNDFSEEEKQTLFMLYGINGENKINQAQIARNIGRTRANVNQIAKRFRSKIWLSRHIKQLDLENSIFDIDYDLQKEIIEEYFKNFDIFVSKEPTTMDEDVKNKLTNMLYERSKKTKKRNEQVDIIKRMSKEEKMDILKERFGERITCSDISVVPPEHSVYKDDEGIDYEEINEKLIGSNRWERISNVFYKECVDSEYTQSKIAEIVVNSFYNRELIAGGKGEEIKEIIANNKYFSKEKKDELEKLLNQRIREAVIENILEEIDDLTLSASSKNLAEMAIADLKLSVRSFNSLDRAGIKLVQDLIGKSEDYLMNLRNIGPMCRDEISEKLQSLGIKIVDGYFEFESTELFGDSEEQTNNIGESAVSKIEEKINSSDILGEDEKEMLRKKLSEKYQEIEVGKTHSGKESLCLEIIDAVKAIPDNIWGTPIKELKLSKRSYKFLKISGITTVQDFVQKTEEELMQLRDFSNRCFDEVIEKMQSLGRKIADGDFVCKNSNNTVLDTDIKNLDDLEGMSKEELVKHILEQQRIIAEQNKEIEELSSQNKEGINK